MLEKDWKQVIVRYIKNELDVLDAFCNKNNLQRTDVIRNATRLYVNNPDLINGVIKTKDVNQDFSPVIKRVDVVVQKLDQIGKKVNSISAKDSFTDPMLKKKITKAILALKHKSVEDRTTVEQLREELKDLDLSFAIHLYPSNSAGISLLDECLFELEQKKELVRKSFSGTGIIEWKR